MLIPSTQRIGERMDRPTNFAPTHLQAVKYCKHLFYDNNRLVDAAKILKIVVEKTVQHFVKALIEYHKMGLALFGIIFALSMPGCSSGPDGNAESDREGRSLFGGVGAGETQDVAAWSIGLATFSGPSRTADAAAAADRFRAADRALADAFVVVRGNQAVVLLGQFASPSSREAVALLED
ncbi:MAG: hypothetical protein AAF235_05790, partial [Planctomycetota bacterium]